MSCVEPKLAGYFLQFFVAALQMVSVSTNLYVSLTDQLLRISQFTRRHGSHWAAVRTVIDGIALCK